MGNHATRAPTQESGSQRRARLPVSGALPLAQPRPDPLAGAPRHSGPVPRLLRRRVLDRSQPAASDGDVLLRLRRRAAHTLRARPWPGGLRPLFPVRNAAVAGGKRSAGTRAAGGSRIPEFREEAGVPDRDSAGEPGPGGAGHGGVRAVGISGVARRDEGRRSLERVVAAGAADPAGAAYDGPGMVPRRAGRLSARPRPDQRIPADLVVLPHPDLLPGGIAAPPGAAAADPQPDVRAGAGIPGHSAGRARAGDGLALEILGARPAAVLRRPRLVLQAAQDVRRRHLRVSSRRT